MELEVAAALLDASRRLSSGEVSSERDLTTNTPPAEGGKTRLRTGSLIPFSAAALALFRTGDLQPANPESSAGGGGWFGGWRRGGRSMSESEGSSSIKIDIMKSLTEGSQDKLRPPQNLQIRRGSSKDIEEAMSGGLSKADLYMPPI